jgi:hypothetical protein
MTVGRATRTGEADPDFRTAVVQNRVVVWMIVVVIVRRMVLVHVIAVRVDVMGIMITRAETSERSMVPMDGIYDGFGIVLVAPQAARQVDVERVLHCARDFRTRIGGLDDQQVALRKVVRGPRCCARRGRVACVE